MYNGASWETFPQGSRRGKTNNYFVYGYTFNIYIFLKKEVQKWVYKEIGELIFLVP